MKTFFTLLLSLLFLTNLVADDVKFSEPKVVKKNKEILRRTSRKKMINRGLVNDKLPKTQIINKKYKLKLNNVILIEEG